MNSRQYRIKDALADPQQAFRSPDSVVSDPRLDRAAKIAILRRWRDDAQALSTAENEGMHGDAPTMLHRIQHAIIRLSEGRER